MSRSILSYRNVKPLKEKAKFYAQSNKELYPKKLFFLEEKRNQSVGRVRRQIHNNSQTPSTLAQLPEIMISPLEKIQEKYFYDSLCQLCDENMDFKRFLDELKYKLREYSISPSMLLQIFLSHAWPITKKDVDDEVWKKINEWALSESWINEFTRTFNEHLVKVGCRVWFDEHQGGGGTVLDPAMEENIGKARHVIALTCRTMEYKMNFSNRFGRSYGVKIEREAYGKRLEEMIRTKDDRQHSFIFFLGLTEKNYSPEEYREGGSRNGVAFISFINTGYLDILKQLVIKIYSIEDIVSFTQWWENKIEKYNLSQWYKTHDIRKIIMEKTFSEIVDLLKSDRDARSILSYKWVNSYSLLMFAVFFKRKDIVIHILKRLKELNMVDKIINQKTKPKIGKGETPLYHICQYQDAVSYEIAEALLRAGANVNEDNTVHVRTAAHEAAGQGNAQLLRLLIRYGANVMARKDYGRTVYELARNEETRLLIQVELNRLASTSREISKIHEIINFQSEEKLKQILDEKFSAEEGYLEVNSLSGEDKITVLHVAVRNLKINAAKIIIEKYKQYGKKYSPIGAADAKNYWNILHEIIRLNYNPAYEREAYDLFKSLLEISDSDEAAKAIVSVHNRNSISPYYEAAFWGRLDIIQLMEEKLQEVNSSVNPTAIPTGDEFTPLMAAVWRKHLHLVKHFLKHSMYKVSQAVNLEGETPLYKIVSMSINPNNKIFDEQILRELITADKTAINTQCTTLAYTPLHIGVIVNSTLCDFLLENGADLFKLDKFGRIPFDFARSAKMKEKLLGKMKERQQEYISWKDRQANEESKFPLHFKIKENKNVFHDLEKWDRKKLGQRNGQGETLVYCAAAAGKCDILKLLIEKFGLDFTIPAEDGSTPLMAALCGTAEFDSKQKETIKYLVEQYILKAPDKLYQDQDIIGENAFYKVSRIYGMLGRTILLECFSSLKSIPHIVTSIVDSKNTSHAKTPLHHAFELHNNEVADCLREKFAAEDLLKDSGRKASEMASDAKRAQIIQDSSKQFSHYEEIIKKKFLKLISLINSLSIKDFKELLLKNLDYLNREGGDPSSSLLHHAIRLTNEKLRHEFVDFLLSIPGIAVDQKNQYSIEPIYEACYMDDFYLVEKLFQHKANLRVRSLDGFSLLHVAAWRAGPKINCYLLANMSSEILTNIINEKSDGLETPLFRAIRANMPFTLSIVRSLVEKGADPNIECGALEETPLLLSIRLGRIDIGLYLIEQGADINKRQIFGMDLKDYMRHFVPDKNKKQELENVMEVQIAAHSSEMFSSHARLKF
jgi:ankyrin repeat protein